MIDDKKYDYFGMKDPPYLFANILRLFPLKLRIQTIYSYVVTSSRAQIFEKYLRIMTSLRTSR